MAGEDEEEEDELEKVRERGEGDDGRLSRDEKKGQREEEGT